MDIGTPAAKSPQEARFGREYPTFQSFQTVQRKDPAMLEMEIFERSPSWRKHPEIERDSWLVTFQESDSRPNHDHVESSWPTEVELEFRLLLDKDQVVAAHSILPIVLDDNCSRRMRMGGTEDSILLLPVHYPWEKQLDNWKTARISNYVADAAAAWVHQQEFHQQKE